VYPSPPPQMLQNVCVTILHLQHEMPSTFKIFIHNGWIHACRHAHKTWALYGAYDRNIYSWHFKHLGIYANQSTYIQWTILTQLMKRNTHTHTHTHWIYYENLNLRNIGTWDTHIDAFESISPQHASGCTSWLAYSKLVTNILKFHMWWQWVHLHGMK
jgi:hypothetical protein